jgi:hypothetical protein
MLVMISSVYNCCFELKQHSNNPSLRTNQRLRLNDLLMTSTEIGDSKQLQTTVHARIHAVYCVICSYLSFPIILTQYKGWWVQYILFSLL